jgi:hypothetical protein
MRNWVAAVAAAVLVAGCGTVPARTVPARTVPPRSDGGPVHPASTMAGGSCPAGSKKSVITLTDTLPVPVVIVPLGAEVVVTVPRWGRGTATDVHVATGGILREECTVLLPGGGRRTFLLAVEPGSTTVGATVAPASGTFMPAWGGEVIVRGPVTARAPSPDSSPATP